MNYFHKSVLLNEVVDFLQVEPGKKYIDATLGGGGHTKAIADQGGIVLSVDMDEDAIAHAKNELKSPNIKIVKGNFKDIAEIAHLQNFDSIAGILFDLGVSSFQLDKAERGFSFQKEGPLDMRMDKSLPIKASDLVNLKTKDELYEIFTKLGQEHHARAISDSLVRARRLKAILSTEDLAKVVEGSFGYKFRPPDRIRARILKKVFQALRIAVNSELENLELGLEGALSILESGGRMLVISFHSLEDRIVKRAFQNFEKQGLGKMVTKKPVTPSLVELKENRRSRSANLRVFEKI
jgi:16S rRNA (cytosine1402-N4)-methyltransferase